MPGSTALAQARFSGAFTSTHEAFWAAARARHGDAEGTRTLIDVLLLHRRMDRAAVLAGLRAALTAGAVTADAVAIEARKATPDLTTRSPAPAPRRSETALVTLQARQRTSGLRPDTRPEPSVARYDQLLVRRTHRDAS